MGSDDIQVGVAADSLSDAQRFGQACDSLGMAVITVGEAATQFVDPFMSLAQLALANKTSLLATGVTTPRLRHAAVLANCYATLAALSHGRAVIGLGSGDIGLTQIGQRPVPLAELEEYATLVRTMSSGGAVALGGRSSAISWADRPVPLWLAADGPRTLALAGRIAEGVIVGQASTPDMVTATLRHVAKAAGAAGRDPCQVPIWFMLRAVVTDRLHSALALDGLANYGARQTHYLWRVLGKPEASELIERAKARKGLTLTEDTADRIVRFAREYSRSVRFSGAENIVLLERHDLLDWSARQFFVAGSAREVRRRVGDLAAAGARNFLIASVGMRDMDERLGRLRSVAAALSDLRGDRGSPN
jgi:5,10-methylenetetrahydromethanopterin reductase